jgi:hypothetical protein
MNPVAARRTIPEQQTSIRSGQFEEETLMRRSLALGATAALALATSDLTFAQNTPANLQIHWIDTEGGAATLIVTPAGESFLIDVGFCARNSCVGNRNFVYGMPAYLAASSPQGSPVR